MSGGAVVRPQDWRQKSDEETNEIITMNLWPRSCKCGLLGSDGKHLETIATPATGVLPQ